MMKNALFGKALAIGVIVMLLIAALMNIGDLISERHSRQYEAEHSIAASQASAQTLLGPVLHRVCTEEWDVVVGEGKDAKPGIEQHHHRLNLVPQTLKVNGDLALEERYRGLFKVNTYTATSTLQAQWPTLASLQPTRVRTQSRLSCGPALLLVTLSDARGIRAAQITANGQTLPPQAGGNDTHPLGFHVALPDTFLVADRPLDAEVKLELLGTSSLEIAPAAHTTDIDLKSSWPHPSFGDRFLPSRHDIGPQGFSAQWRVSSLATTAPASFERGGVLCGQESPAANGTTPCIETLGVSFIDPVNPYSLSDRAIKYGMLFIALTFVAVAMVEVMQRVRVHPVQYLLVGTALSLFFLLLVSLSEHLSFGWAYAAASFACVALLSFYARHMLRGWKAGLGFGAGIATLYGALYVLLQMEQTALVMGSILLFVVLALVMIVTRKLDWYGLFDHAKAAAPVAPRPAPSLMAQPSMPATE